MHQNMKALRLPEEASARSEYSISDLARSYDVSLRTLRFYEDKGLLHPRREGTTRLYSARDRIQLELVLKGKKLGFTLAEIQELIESRTKSTPSSTPFTDLTVVLDRQQISTQIKHLERQRDDLDAAIAELHLAYERMAEPVV